MGYVSANRAGLSAAAVLAGWHAVWVLLVAGGVAQRVLDFAYEMHGLKADAVVGPLDAGRAALLLLATAAIGYASGVTAAWVWNCLQRLQAREASTSQRAGAAASSTPRQAA